MEETIDGILDRAVAGDLQGRFRPCGEKAELRGTACVARATTAGCKQPRYVRILPDMPRTDVGKPARGALVLRARTEIPDLASVAE